MNSASECHEDISLALIKKGATLANRDKQGYTALHLAAFHGCVFTTEAILKKDKSFINYQV
jgi:ankyrin repeat protein